MLFCSSEQAKPPARVVVTGAGIISGLGVGWAANEDGFRNGHSAFGPVTLFDVSRQRVKTAAEVRLPDEVPCGKLSRKRQARADRASQLLMFAADEAMRSAGGGVFSRAPIVLGTTSGGMNSGEAYYRQALSNPGKKSKQATRVTQYDAQQQTADIAEAFALEGPVTLIANACASGANAIGHAWEIIRSGRANSALAGGYEALSQMVFAGFDALQALSPTQCRPFDAHRDGLALGEGAGLLCLESLETALQRNASILGEIIGYGAVTDSHHLTQPHPLGEAALAAMRQACGYAGIAPAEVDYINAHGTGTPLNDASEAAAISAWAGESAQHVKVSSTKACVGHLLGAAGAVEAVLSLMVLRGQWLPPNVGLRNIDKACNFEVVTKPQTSAVNLVLSNSFGFGGSNASLLFRRWS